MKLKNWIIAGIITAGVAVHFSFTSIPNAYSGISLANIEALTSEYYYTTCWGTGSLDCPVDAEKVLAITYL
jgi:hypothetical protein